jgi:tetratricopeptide (TPR) repeat protein
MQREVPSPVWTELGISGQDTKRRFLAMSRLLVWVAALFALVCVPCSLSALDGAGTATTAELEKAVAGYYEALSHQTRDPSSAPWGVTQFNLANALVALGERESGSGHLEQALNAYAEAMVVFDRKRAPMQWAVAKNNLGNALVLLGTRQNGVARLEEAIAAFREALSERTPDRVPLDWAATQTTDPAAGTNQLGCHPNRPRSGSFDDRRTIETP